MCLKLNPDAVRDAENLLQCSLGRTGTHPLNLHILESSSQESIIPIITRYSSRWKSLQLTIVQPLAFRGRSWAATVFSNPFSHCRRRMAACADMRALGSSEA
jgi:hypothetical protein